MIQKNLATPESNNGRVIHLHVALGLDVDRDAPFPKTGLVHGVSLPLFFQDDVNLQDPSNSALFEGTELGLQCLLDDLDIAIPKVFFLEGRTAIHLRENHSDLLSKMEQQASVIGFHGMDHEDLVGSKSQVYLTTEDGFKILANGMRAIQSVLGVKPRIFRAPYMQIGYDLLSRLPLLGIKFDSSLYIETTTPPVPYRVLNSSPSLWEVPVVKYPEADRKFIYLYLWPLFERKTHLKDYIHVLQSLSQNEESKEKPGFCLVNLHPWHLAYSINKRRYLSKRELADNLMFLHHIIDALLDQIGIEFCLPSILEK